ncbi:MAG: hypothetical protein ACRDX8_11715 [Acidimicrobiales bacterium]
MTTDRGPARAGGAPRTEARGSQPERSDWFERATAQGRAAVFTTARLAQDSPPRPFRLGDRVFALFGSELNASVGPWYPWPGFAVSDGRDRFVSGVLVGDDPREGTTLIYTGSCPRPSDPVTLRVVSARLACPCSAGLGDDHVHCEWSRSGESARQAARAIELRRWFLHLSNIAPDGRVAAAPPEVWVAMAALEAFGIVSARSFGPATYGHRNYYATAWANAGRDSAWPSPESLIRPELSDIGRRATPDASPRRLPLRGPGPKAPRRSVRPLGLPSPGGGICT